MSEGLRDAVARAIYNVLGDCPPWRPATFDEDVVQAYLEAADAALRVVAVRSAGRKTCGQCGGKRSLDGEHACPSCAGTGKNLDGFVALARALRTKEGA